MFKRLQVYIAALALVAFTACGNESTERQRGQASTPAVEAIRASVGSLPLEERVSGIVRAENQVDIFPQVSGVVEQVLVENGDQVTKGQVIARLRKGEFLQRINQATSALDIAKAREAQALAALKQMEAQIKRTRELADKKLASELELETLEAQLMGAKANHDLAKAQTSQAFYALEEQKILQGQYEIRSPIAGNVGLRSVEEGQLVTSTNRIFVVGDLDNYRIQFTLTEDHLGYIKEGQTAIIRSKLFPGGEFDAPVARISPFLDPVSHTTNGEIDIKNANGLLKPGMFVNVDIRYGESELATLIPNAALYKNPRTGLEGVFVAKSIGLEIEPASTVNPDAPPPFTDATPITFVPVEVVARGRHTSGISKVGNGEWVVTIGQNLLLGQQPQARVRAVNWNRVLTLQQLKEADLLDALISSGRGDTSTSTQNATM